MYVYLVFTKTFMNWRAEAKTSIEDEVFGCLQASCIKNNNSPDTYYWELANMETNSFMSIHTKVQYTNTERSNQSCSYWELRSNGIQIQIQSKLKYLVS